MELKPFCSGSLIAPANFVANILYAGEKNCDKRTTFMEFTALNVCITTGTNASLIAIFDSFYKEVTVYQYSASPNCTAGTSNISSNIKIDSYTLALSSSLLNAIASKFLTAIILILSLYLF